MEHQESPIPLVILAGPTASGKSEIALSLAERIGGEIVNADSVQVYRFLDIGTSKPSPGDRAKIPHHLIDIRNPDEEFSVGEFRRLARAAVLQIRERGKVPLAVGGTGLYLQTFTACYTYGPGRNEEAREKARELADLHGLETGRSWLAEADPVGTAPIHPHDGYRIRRALEIVLTDSWDVLRDVDPHAFFSVPLRIRLGKAVSIRTREPLPPPYRVSYWILEPERGWLYERINARVDGMMERGFLSEVRGLLERGYTGDLKPMRTLGYRQLVEVLENRISLEEGVARIKQETRRFAKRQFTWFRKVETARRIPLHSQNDVGRAAERMEGDREFGRFLERAGGR